MLWVVRPEDDGVLREVVDLDAVLLDHLVRAVDGIGRGADAHGARPEFRGLDRIGFALHGHPSGAASSAPPVGTAGAGSCPAGGRPAASGGVPVISLPRAARLTGA